MRPSYALAVAAISLIGLSAALLAWLSPESAVAADQKIVCLTDFTESGAYGIYKRRPRKCVIHERGEPFASVYLVNLKKLRWSYWGGQARGRGIIRGNMGYKAKARIKLTKPRSPCGPTVYTVASIRYRGDSNGRMKVHLDNCLR